MALKEEFVGSMDKIDTDFVEAYPIIEKHLACKVSQKTVLATFNSAYGHAIHPPRFRTMLEAERKRRSQNGEEVVCATCGQQLHRVSENESSDVE
jgi:hypothetical protein